MENDLSKEIELKDLELEAINGGEDEDVDAGSWFCPSKLKRVNIYTCGRCDKKSDCDTYRKHK